MEQINLNKIGADIEALRIAVQGIQEYLMDEVSDEVMREVEKARKDKGVSHEDVVKEFCND